MSEHQGSRSILRMTELSGSKLVLQKSAKLIPRGAISCHGFGRSIKVHASYRVIRFCDKEDAWRCCNIRRFSSCPFIVIHDRNVGTLFTPARIWSNNSSHLTGSGRSKSCVKAVLLSAIACWSTNDASQDSPPAAVSWAASRPTRCHTAGVCSMQNDLLLQKGMKEEKGCNLTSVPFWPTYKSAYIQIMKSMASRLCVQWRAIKDRCYTIKDHPAAYIGRVYTYLRWYSNLSVHAAFLDF